MKQILTYEVESYIGIIFLVISAIIILIIGWRIFVNVNSDIDTINSNLGQNLLRLER